MLSLKLYEINLFLKNGASMAVLRPETYPDRLVSKFRFWGWSECFLIFDLDPDSD